MDKLETMVTSLFREVRCSDPPVNRLQYSYEHHPYGAKQLKHKVYIVPLRKNLQYLFLNFPVPDIEILNQYEAAVSIEEKYNELH